MLIPYTTKLRGLVIDMKIIAHLTTRPQSMKNIFHTERNDLKRISEMLTVLAHPVCLQMVHHLLEKKALNVTELQRYFDLTQSTISQHLGKLKSHKTVAYARKGLEVFYRVDDEKIKQILKILIG